MVGLCELATAAGFLRPADAWRDQTEGNRHDPKAKRQAECLNFHVKPQLARKERVLFRQDFATFPYPSKTKII